MQDAVRDGSTTPLHEDAITRVARCIFAYHWPQAWWSDPAYKRERDDCILLAAQFREIFAERWTPFNAAELLTNHSCELLFGSLVPNTNVRNVVRDYAQSYLEDLSTVFTGDGAVRPEFQRVKGVQ